MIKRTLLLAVFLLAGCTANGGPELKVDEQRFGFFSAAGKRCIDYTKAEDIAHIYPRRDGCAELLQIHDSPHP